MRWIIAAELAVVKVILAKRKLSLLSCKSSLRKRKDSTLMVATERRKWLALALLSAVQFMVVLDIAIVNVALPSIKIDLGFSQENLQWVISAYALFFGGFLLLGGRAADLLGRRRLFLAAAGVLLGGVLTETLSWSWIFFVNVPVGVAAFFLAPRLLDESRDTTVKSFDALGAVLVTGGLVSLVYAITQSGTYGWGSGRTIGVIAAAVALLAAFGWWERRHAEPLMRFGILRTKTVAGANVGGLILGTATFSLFLMLTLYMQQVLGYSPMKTGVAYLAVAGSAILWSAVAAQLVTRIGVKPVLVAGMVALTSGLVYFTQVSVHGTYLSDLLPGFLLVGVGLGFSFVPISIAALAGVRPAEAGLASGLFNTTQQIGGALGIAVLSTIATSRSSHALADGTALPSALVHGFTGAFVVGAGIAAVGIVAALTLIRRDELAQAPEQLEPVLDLAA